MKKEKLTQDKWISYHKIALAQLDTGGNALAGVFLTSLIDKSSQKNLEHLEQIEAFVKKVIEKGPEATIGVFKEVGNRSKAAALQIVAYKDNQVVRHLLACIEGGILSPEDGLKSYTALRNMRPETKDIVDNAALKYAGSNSVVWGMIAKARNHPASQPSGSSL